jgi:hypothetical protein
MNEPFAMIPHRLWMECRSGEKPKHRPIIVYLAIAHYLSIQNIEQAAGPTANELASLAGIKVDDIWLALKWLEQRKWITRKQQAGKASQYFIYDWLNRPFAFSGSVHAPEDSQTHPPNGGYPPKQGVGSEGGTSIYSNNNIYKTPPFPPKGGRTREKPSKTEKKAIVLTESMVPAKLSFLSTRICDFWNTAKSGQKTPKAMDFLFNSCLKILEHELGGKDELELQFDSAFEAAGKGNPWQSISYVNWWRFIGSRRKNLPANSSNSSSPVKTIKPVSYTL